MKIRRTDIAFAVGILLILWPWILDRSLSWLWYLGCLPATVLLAIAGYGAQMRQLKQGDPGEDLLRQAADWCVSTVKRIFRRNR